MPKRAAVPVDEPGGPFNALPTGLHHHLRPLFADITEEVVRAIRTGIPEYARPADLFGGQLHDPAAQFEMQLALRALELRRGATGAAAG